ncbi:MAG TPA: cytochrome C oxidase subunit IV family protein [Anaeromyxobacteraceae bacterium]|nr:cytochrome C oxidase subunit IV family protein [Anaeromyxobacteraceae bacterium]
MANPSAPVSHDEEERVRHISASRYYVVWVALLVFTALTIFTARGVHIPSPWHLLVGLAIAVVKAALVALFFMHLWDHGGTTRLVLVTALVFLALLIGITVLDNATRFELSNPVNDRNERFMPPGPDILSPMAVPRGGRLPERSQGAGETGGAPARPGGGH